jgi:predicted nucleic acid-binding protein
MFDTNVLLSAMFSDAGNPFRAIELADTLGFELCTCREIEDEVQAKIALKWPELLPTYLGFRSRAPFALVVTPAAPDPAERGLRDIKDRPIYRAAAAARVDEFVTGDRDLLEFEGAAIQILTPAAFVARHTPE